MNMYENKLNTPSGFRDLLPDEAVGREHIVECITRVYKRFGFLPLETPVAEFENILLSESASDFNVFRLESTNQRLSREKEDVALRFDLTVPLARVVSQYGNALPRPFKRYQSGYVFRGERPQKGRYRQFMQFDADIVGAKNIISDSEMIVMITEIMSELQVSDFIVRVNTRTILNTLPEFIGFPQNILREVLVVLDKAEKISGEELVEELRRLRIAEDGIKKIQDFSNIASKPQDALTQLRNFFGDYPAVQSGIQELEKIAEHLRDFNVENLVIFDMKIIRGFAYYTGPVFETNILSAPEFGSVISGGRYDNLVERFMSQSLPAVGVSVGVDRLQTALHARNTLVKNFQKILVFSQVEYSSYVIQVAQTLGRNNDFVDIYQGSKKDFKDVFQYAESINASHVVIVGAQEEEQKTVSVRNMSKRSQSLIPFAELTSYSFTNN